MSRRHARAARSVAAAIAVAFMATADRLLAPGAATDGYGESWGAGRAGSVSYALATRGIKVDGVVLISGATGLTSASVPASLRTAMHDAELAATGLFQCSTPRHDERHLR